MSKRTGKIFRKLKFAESSVISGWAVIATITGTFLLAIFYAKSTDDFVPFLDHTNLAFHEAGHIFFGFLGSTLGLYGGTLGQLVFPVTVTISFWRRQQTVSAVLGILWFFQNLINIARYMADARARQLPLVGGGEHDWTHILLRWGALSADTSIARFLTGIAWFGMTMTVLWLVYFWNKKRVI